MEDELMANPWFRLYSEFATDPKVQMMSEAYQRRYLMLLCIKCSNGDETLQDDQVAFQLRISEDEWASTKAAFIEKNLINDDAVPLAWNKRQYVSDSSTPRVAAYREKKKRERNVSVTPPDTETESDTEHKKQGADAPAKSGKFDPLTAKPANVSDKAWADWCQHRKEIRKPLTAKSCEQQAKALEGHATPDQVLATSIANGWTGIFPEKSKGNVHQFPASRHTGFENRDYTAGLTARGDGTYDF
jgi:hypothetical protein